MTYRSEGYTRLWELILHLFLFEPQQLLAAEQHELSQRCSPLSLHCGQYFVNLT